MSTAPEMPTVAPRGKILIMGAIAGAVATNIYCTQPILPLIAESLNVELTMANLVAGAALLGFATGLAFLLPLGDRVDRRQLILWQVVIAFIVAVVSAVAPNIGTLIAASFVFGVVSGVPQQLVPFAATMSPPAERGRSVGTVVGGIMVGILLGRTISGGLGALYGWRAVYVFQAGLMVPVWFFCKSLLPKSQPTTDLSYGRLLASLWPLVRDHRAIRDSMFVQALLWACFNAFWVNLAALLVNGPWHLNSAWAGAFGIIGAAGAFAASAGGRLADKRGPRYVVGLSIGVVLLSYIILAGANASLALLVIGVILLDVGVQAGLVSNQTRAFSADPRAQGRINSLYMTAIFTGGGLGVAISGWLMTQYGWIGVVLFGVALGTIGLAYHWFSAPRKQAIAASPDIGA